MHLRWPPTAGRQQTPSVCGLQWQRLVGRILERIGETQVKIALLDGTERTLFWADIEAQFEFENVQIGMMARYGDTNPNRTRHLYAPSAMPLKEGEGYLSLKELFFLSGAYGVTDNVSILVGGFCSNVVSYGWIELDRRLEGGWRDWRRCLM